METWREHGTAVAAAANLNDCPIVVDDDGCCCCGYGCGGIDCAYDNGTHYGDGDDVVDVRCSMNRDHMTVAADDGCYCHHRLHHAVAAAEDQRQ